MWASRWDTYLSSGDVQIHWFSIVNSLVVVFFLSGILTMIMIRTLRRDIARYNTDDNYEDTLEETGWKLVHGDVFRPPKHPRLFAAIVGSGIQIFFMALITICEYRGVFSPTLFPLDFLAKSLALPFAPNSYSHAGHAVAIVSRRTHHLGHPAVRVYGPDCRLLFGAALQNDEGTRVEARRLSDGNLLSGHRVRHMLLPELLHLEQALERCGAVQHDAVAVDAVVRHCGAVGLFGLLLWLSQASVSASGANEHDSETSADAALVYESAAMVISAQYIFGHSSPYSRKLGE